MECPRYVILFPLHDVSLCTTAARVPVVPDGSDFASGRLYVPPVLTNDCTDHARLKDHVAYMKGGLKAKINEGFVFLSHCSTFLGAHMLCSDWADPTLALHGVTRLPDSSLHHMGLGMHTHVFQCPS